MKGFLLGLAALLLGLTKSCATNVRYQPLIPSNEYQSHFDEFSGDGYILRLVTAFEDTSGDVYFNSIWHENVDRVTWRSYHGMTESDYQTKFDTWTAQGYQLVFVDGYSITGSDSKKTPRINAIFEIPSSSPAWVARHGQSSSDYQSTFDEVTSNGFDLAVVSTYESSTFDERYASLFIEGGNDNAWLARHGMDFATYKKELKLRASEGYKLDYVSAGTITGNDARFAALWSLKEMPEVRTIRKVKQKKVRKKLRKLSSKGFYPVVIDGYVEKNGKAYFTLLFSTEIA